MPKHIIPITKADEADPGASFAVGAVVASQTLNTGWYKLAAVGTPLQWKKGATPVTPTTGSYLGDNDQEIIEIEADNTTLSFIEAPNSTAGGAGYINITIINIKEAPGADPRNYDLL